MVTLKDVARESGFSTATVSVVLNNANLARHIPNTTKLHIKQVAKSLGYQPNHFAQYLRKQRSETVGVMMFDIADPYCAQILKGIENSLYRSGYLALLADVQNGRARFKHFVDMLLQRRIEGLIAIANSLYVEVDLLDAFEQRKIPSVIIGREFETNSMSWVAIDNERGTYAEMNHLYALGHRRFAFIKGPRKVVDSSLRWAGIRRFAEEFELDVDPELVVELNQQASSYDGGCSATVKLLECKHPFTALVTFDDITAFGAICALRSAGRSVPEDCSVVGFDDVAAAAFYNPSLTTVRQPMERLGSMGIELLINSINVLRKTGTFVREQRKVSPELVVRESSAPPA